MQRRSPLNLKRQKNKVDFWIALIIITLSVFGLIMLYEASNVSAFNDFGDKYYYVKEQAVFFVAGFVALLVTANIHYKKYYVLSVPLLILTIIALFAVFIPGIGVTALGAKRWINIGSFNFQPSELAKLSLILYLSSWLSGKERKRLVAFFILLALIIGLIVLQPDLGTAVILSTIFFIIYFFSQAPLWHFILLVPMSLIAIIIMAIVSPYRLLRLSTFINPNYDPLGASYHLRQILISFGSGGFWGVGLGASRQKYQFLPEATTDSIFAIIAEELGYLGSVIVIVVYFVLIYRIYRLVKSSPDKLSMLLTGGILAFFGFQICINLGSMVAIFPLTGIPLPFISYGGSNLIVSQVAAGILLNISKYQVEKK